jgi:type I restriction enzyme S subunit
MMNMPKYWDVAKTGEMYDFTKKPKEIVYSNYDYLPFIVMDLIPVGSTYSGNFKLKKSTEISSGTYIEDGDILLAKITPCFENGKQCIITGLPNGFGIASTEIIPIKEKTGTSSKYFLFYYLLQSDIRTLIAGKMEGATGRQRVPVHLIKELLIPFPSLNEQQKIAAVLFKIQQAIEIQVAIIEKTRELKKSTLHHVFTNGLRGEKLKETEIGPMPESWEAARVGKYCQKPEYGFTESAIADEIGPKFLRITDITENGVNWNTVPYCRCSQNLFPKYELKENDILFARIGATTGKSHIVKNPPRAIFASYLIRLRPLYDLVPAYLYDFFNSEAYWDQVNANKKNNLKGGVNSSFLSDIIFPLPSKSEQMEIANIILTIDHKIEIHTAKKSTLQDLFKTMLNKLMTGEIRVKDLDIDVSEVST